METFGSGNAPCEEWFLNMLKEAVDRGIVIVNVTQCRAEVWRCTVMRRGTNCWRQA